MSRNDRGERALEAFVQRYLEESGDYPDQPMTGNHNWRRNFRRGAIGWECADCLVSDLQAAKLCTRWN